MNELQVFNNDLFGEIRFVEVEGKPYAVANDVAKALGYKNPTDAVNTKCMNIVKHEVENSRGQMRMTNPNNVCGGQMAWFLTEQGLYEVRKT